MFQLAGENVSWTGNTTVGKTPVNPNDAEATLTDTVTLEAGWAGNKTEYVTDDPAASVS